MVGSPIGRPAHDAGMMSRADRPHPGSALAKVLGPTGGVPPFVMVPEAIQPNGPERSGQFAGFLGAAFDPYRINSDPNLPDYSPGVLRPPSGSTRPGLGDRRALLDAVDDASARPRDRGDPPQRDEYLRPRLRPRRLRRGAACLRHRRRTARDARPLRPPRLRPVRPAGPADGRGRRPPGPRQLGPARQRQGGPGVRHATATTSNWPGRPPPRHRRRLRLPGGGPRRAAACSTRPW